MKIEMRCFANLAESESCDYRESSKYDVQPNTTAGDLVRQTGISEKSVKIIFVNGKASAPDTVLAEGDRVGLVPAVGGM